MVMGILKMRAQRMDGDDAFKLQMIILCRLGARTFRRWTPDLRVLHVIAHHDIVPPR